jgi:hypothetical protein
MNFIWTMTPINTLRVTFVGYSNSKLVIPGNFNPSSKTPSINSNRALFEKSHPLNPTKYRSNFRFKAHKILKFIFDSVK